MENEKKFPTYGTKQKFLEGIALNRGKNLLITSEVRKRDTGEFIKEEQRIVYEKYVDGDVKYIINHYDEDLVYYPDGNKEIVIIMKNVKPDVEDDIFTVKTAKGSTKRKPINME